MKQFRPYTLAEFIHNVGNVGDFVHYRLKSNHNEVLTVITEIRETSGFVVLGNLLINTERLLNEFEYYDNPSWYEYGTWKPFGVSEE